MSEHDLFFALLEHYQELCETDINPQGLEFSFEEPFDDRGREFVVYTFQVIDEDNFEISLSLNARHPLWSPRTQVYLKQLAYRLGQDKIIVECLEVNSITLRAVFTSDVDEDSLDELVEKIVNIVINLAKVIHSVLGVAHINYRLMGKSKSSEKVKQKLEIKQKQLVELTLCSWKPDRIILLC